MQVTLERMEKSLDYLVSTDEDYARAKTLFDGLTNQRKSIKARNYLNSPSSTAGAKEQSAYHSIDYQQHLQKIEVAELEYLTLQAKRNTECAIIDCWRSVNANRAKGLV